MEIISSFDKQEKTPAESFFDFFSSFRAAVESINEGRIIISDAAWKVLSYIFFFGAIYFFREPLFDGEGVYITTAVLAVLLGTDLFLRNWGPIKGFFKPQRKIIDDSISTEGAALDILNKIRLDSESIVRLIDNIYAKGQLSQRVVDVIMGSQEMTTPIAKKLIECDISSIALIRLLKENENIFDKKSLDEIIIKWKNDREVITSCIMTQELTADILHENKIVDTNTFQKIRTLRFNESKINDAAIILSAVLSILFGGLIFSATQNNIITANETIKTNYILAVAILAFFLYMGAYFILKPTLNRCAWNFIRWKANRIMKQKNAEKI
ncbi:Uncharacterised protein [uncultured archaeon]|nr:Uncharacterised protein [uncultured archaeon]